MKSSQNKDKRPENIGQSLMKGFGWLVWSVDGLYWSIQKDLVENKHWQ